MKEGARRRPEEREAADERILGSGAFVEEIWRVTEAVERREPSRTWQQILEETARQRELSGEHILGPSRERRVSRARRVFYLRAVEEGGVSITQLARLTDRNPASVSRAVTLARDEAARESVDSHET